MSEIFVGIANGFAMTLSAALASVPLVLVMLALDYTVCRRVAARYRCVLWTLVAVRLLMPYAPESSLSLQSVWRLFDAQPESQTEIGFAAVASDGLIGRLAGEPVNVGEWMANPFAQAPAKAVDWVDRFLFCLAIVWFVGVAIVLLRAVVASARFAWRVRGIELVQDGPVVDQLLRVCDQVGVGRRPRLKYVPELSTPALFAVWRPTLCLPVETSAQLNLSQLRLIMLHEVIHLRRRDGLISWLLTFVQAVHWFNPIAWLTRKRIAIYRELACDDAVRRFTTPAERPAYTELLLRFATGQAPTSLGFVGLWFAQPMNQLTARIEAFHGDQLGQRKLTRLAMSGLVGLLAVVGLTDAASWDAKDKSLEESMVGVEPALHQFHIPPLEEEDKGAIEERIYNLAPALEKIVAADPGRDARLHILSFLKMPFLQVESVVELAGDTDRIRVTMSQWGHDFFTNVLDAIELAGPWQVSVESRVFGASDIEALGDINWEEAVKFVLPTATKTSRWPQRVKREGSQPESGISAVVESGSWEYGPYMVMVIDQDQLRRIVERSRRGPRNSYLAFPKVTLFNGQRGHVRDESQRPFVVGVQYIKGELATAAQPEIVVLSEGVQLEVQPWVVDANAIELSCQLTMSQIDGVSEVKLPGKDIVVQNPRQSRRTISTSCQLARGETLLIAPHAVGEPDAETEIHYYAITPTWFPDTVAERTAK